ncbi:hypothetical protein KIN20_010204 [Parelaphostrongylus tenuis]|uniref:Uncharacterized protein n=1 Tax=Parelaphostrongylus tenuis TaxID=148309 RepID=A0AAD5M996_PARTN|nr:hypothetical protein KIN20_010204 [Parelaphostrongylus tenuis]
MWTSSIAYRSPGERAKSSLDSNQTRQPTSANSSMDILHFGRQLHGDRLLVDDSLLACRPIGLLIHRMF